MVAAPQQNGLPGQAQSPAAPGQPAAPGSPAVAPTPPPSTVKVIIKTTPSRFARKRTKAKVFWGKKLLGEAPLTIERPRDSGPMDLVVRVEDFFPVHVRAFTFKNDVLTVQLTKLTDRMSLFGAKAELPPPADPTATPLSGAATPNGAPPVPAPPVPVAPQQPPKPGAPTAPPTAKPPIPH